MSIICLTRGMSFIGTTTFGIFVDDNYYKLHTLFWLPKLLKRLYKSRFIANSSVLASRVFEYDFSIVSYII